MSSVPAKAPPPTKEEIAVGVTPQGMKTIKDMLDQYKNVIQTALPRHMTVDRMIRVAVTSVQKNEKLLKCAPITLIGAVIQLAQLGLEPDDGTGKAYLIPFWNSKKNRMEVQAMAGFKGLVHLARNSGEIRDVIPHAVYEKDSFSYQFGTEQILTHIPFSGKDRGAIINVYAIARYKDNGQPAFDVMTMEQVEEIHQEVVKKNKGDFGPWLDHYDEMAKKTVVRRLCKHLPSSPELQKAIAMDEKADFGIPQDLGKFVLGEDEPSSEAIEAPAPPQRISAAKPVENVAVIGDIEKAHIVELLQEYGIKPASLDEFMQEKYGFSGLNKIPSIYYQAICHWIEKGPEIEFGS